MTQVTGFMAYAIIKDLKLPAAPHPLSRSSLDDLVVLAKEMQTGDAVHLTLSEAQTFRVILVALGFCCVCDGHRSAERGKTLAFKLPVDFR